MLHIRPTLLLAAAILNLTLLQASITPTDTAPCQLDHEHAPATQTPTAPKPAADNHDHDKDDGHDHAPAPAGAADHDDDHDHKQPEPSSADTLFLSREQQREAGLQSGTVAQGMLPETLELLGTIVIDPFHQAVVVSPLPGFIRSLAVRTGAPVRQGETLLTLFSPELAEWKNDCLTRQRAVDLARKTFERKDTLRQQNIASEADWQEAQFALEQAIADQQFASRRLRALGLPQTSIDQLAQQDPADFGLFTVTAPITGVIMELHAITGARVEHEPLLQIADTQTLLAEFPLNPKYLNQVQTGQDITVTPLDGPASTGTLTRIAPALNPANQAVTVSVSISNPDGHWRPGLFVRGELTLPGNRTAVLVPAEAVHDLDNQPVVFIPSGGEAFTIRPVRRGRQRAGIVEILDGLDHGQTIVTIGAFTLKAVKATSGLDSHAGHGH